MSQLNAFVLGVAKIAAAIVAVIVMGAVGYAAQPPLIPLTNPTERLEFEGFSFLPPQGENWFVFSSERRRQLGPDVIASFQKLNRPLSITHTVNAIVRGGQIPPTEGRAELPQRIARLNFVQTERERPISVNVSSDSTLAPDCVRYDGIVEDRGVPRFPGSVFVTEMHGFVCLRPDLLDAYIEIQYSQRRLQEESPLSLEAEGESFLRSLVFGKSPTSASPQPTDPKPAPDRTWKRLPIYTHTPILAEQARENVFAYSVQAALQTIEQFYLPRLEENGWRLIKRDASETSKYGGPGVYLRLEGEKRTGSILIVVNTQDRVTLVVLACFGKDGRSACEDD